MPFAWVVFLTPSPCDGWPVVMLFTVGASRCFGGWVFLVENGGEGFSWPGNIRSFSVFFLFFLGGGRRREGF